MKRFWNTWWGKLIVVVIVAAIGIGVYYISSKNTNKSAGSSTNYITAAVRKGTITVNVNGSGTMQANNETDVTVDTSGTVKKVYFKEGDTVKKGDLMYEIENKDLPLSIKEAEINIKQMQADANGIKQQMAKATVTAPASGLITLGVSSGDQVTASMPIATIQDISKLSLTASTSADKAMNIKAGQSVKITATGVSGSFTGTVSQVSAYSQGEQIGAATIAIDVNNSGSKLKPGNTATATITTSAGAVVVSGQLVSKSSPVQVKAPLSGNVQTLYVSDGSVVAKGQKILKFDMTDLQNNLDLQNVKIQQAQLDLNGQKDKLNELKVYAPVSGVIVQQNVEEGDDIGSISSGSSASLGSTAGLSSMLGAGSSTGAATTDSSGTTSQSKGNVIAVIADSSKYQVVIPVDELDINKIKIGQKAIVTADALPDQQFDGEVTDVSDQGTTQNGVSTFDVTVSFDKKDGMKIGMTADADITAQQKDDVLIVPIEAVVERNGKKYVMVYNENTTNGSKTSATPSASSMHEVKTGINNESYIEIVSGLSEGERVILQGTTSTNNAPLMQFQGGGNSPFGGSTQRQNSSSSSQRTNGQSSPLTSSNGQ